MLNLFRAAYAACNTCPSGILSRAKTQTDSVKEKATSNDLMKKIPSQYFLQIQNWRKNLICTNQCVQRDQPVRCTTKQPHKNHNLFPKHEELSRN